MVVPQFSILANVTNSPISTVIVRGYSFQLPSPLFFASNQERADNSFPDLIVLAGDLNRRAGASAIRAPTVVKITDLYLKPYRTDLIWSFLEPAEPEHEEAQVFDRVF